MTTPQQRAADTKRARTRARAVKAVDKLLRKAKNETLLPRMEEIAVLADVGTATLYQTFGGRDQLLVEAFKDLVLKPLDEEVARLNKVADLQPVQKLTFYFMALDKMSDKGRWRLFQAAHHSRIDIPGPKDSDIDEGDTILTTLAGHIRELGPELHYSASDFPELVALRLFDALARGGHIAEEKLLAEDFANMAAGSWLLVEMNSGKLARVDR